MAFLGRIFGFPGKLEPSELIYGATDKGVVRKSNEDFFSIDERKRLFIAADGMGGHNAGEVASLHATKILNQYFSEDLINEIRGNPELISAEMKGAVLYAHQKIMEMAGKEKRYRGMGCTIIVALIDETELHLCHVGDTRAYICKNTDLSLLTTDHSYVQSLVNKGDMTLEEARKSPIRNKITQAIGVPEKIKPEYTHYQLCKDDKLLLCSDGLWDMLPDDTIWKIMKKHKPAQEICKKLIEKAKTAGGKDNITVIVAYN